jgi:hypothetical protein
LTAFALVVGFATSNPFQSAEAANPYQGNYIGTETLEGGSTVSAGDYPLKITITAKGKINITDVDGISAWGKVKNSQFKVVRPRPGQIFEGEIIDKTISGVTTENVYTGDGTFVLELQED